jgi:hypothetical protein
LRERYPDRAIFVYPDASGASRKTNDASSTDISLLEASGFVIYADASNPRVRDRVIAANVALAKKLVLVNSTTCPNFARSLEQLTYDANGVPDKKSNHDHIADAGTYPIWQAMPVERPAATLNVRYAR